MSIMGDQYFSEGQKSHVSASEMAARRAFQHGVASRIIYGNRIFCGSLLGQQFQMGQFLTNMSLGIFSARCHNLKMSSR